MYIPHWDKVVDVRYSVIQRAEVMARFVKIYLLPWPTSSVLSPPLSRTLYSLALAPIPPTPPVIPIPMHPYLSEFLYLKSGFSFENKHR
jgi:hypothetical protein